MTMHYKPLGKTGIDVSTLCLGTMTFGEQNSESEAFAQMNMALEAGINFFDAAELYPIPPRPETQGLTETIIGNWFKLHGNREKVVLATKVTGRGDANSGVSHIRGGPRLDGDQIRQAVEASLERLQTDYIDLYQLHWPERRTNFFGQLGYRHSDDDGVAIEDTLTALQELVEWGMVRQIGVSNETPWGLMAFSRLAKEHDLPLVQSLQNPYNLLNRSAEVGLAEMCMREQIAFLAYSPLAFGVLTGKYLGGAKPEGARLTRFSRFARYMGEQSAQATEAYAALAREQGLSLTHMALAFLRQQPWVTSTIVGATSTEQLADNIASLAVTLDPTCIEEIESIHRRYTIPAP